MRSGASLPLELGREAVGSFVLFAVGVGATALAVHGGWWRIPVISAGFAVGQVVAFSITRGPVLRVNPVASLISWIRGDISAGLAGLSVVVQVMAMTTACAFVRAITGVSAADLVETTPSIVTTVVVVGSTSLIWFLGLTGRPGLGRLGLLYGGLHLVGLPLHGGSLNPARTVAPILLGAPTGAVLAFSLPPVAAALVVVLVRGPAHRRDARRWRSR